MKRGKRAGSRGMLKGSQKNVGILSALQTLHGPVSSADSTHSRVRAPCKENRASRVGAMSSQGPGPCAHAFTDQRSWSTPYMWALS